MFSISRKARWVMLMIFVASGSFSAIQHVAQRADMVDRPGFGTSLLTATSSSVAWLLATRILQAAALQIIAVLGLQVLLDKRTAFSPGMILGFVTLLELKTVSQLIQAWGLFHNVWHAREFVNAAEVLVEAILVALIVTWKTQGGASVETPGLRP